jgi:hypothetical protein
MSEDSESFSMADYFDRNYDRTWLFYKFTISSALGMLILNIKPMQITAKKISFFIPSPPFPNYT